MHNYIDSRFLCARLSRESLHVSNFFYFQLPFFFYCQSECHFRNRSDFYGGKISRAIFEFEKFSLTLFKTRRYLRDSAVESSVEKPITNVFAKKTEYTRNVSQGPALKSLLKK